MAFCAACGAALTEGAAACPKCGKAVGADAAAGSTAAAATGSGLAENVAGLLCYVLGWLTGLVFFLTDKRPSVRFHAMQSIIVFGGLNVIQFGTVFFIRGIVGWALASAISGLCGLLALVCWIVCMLKAFQGERFKLPVVGDMAEQYSK